MGKNVLLRAVIGLTATVLVLSSLPQAAEQQKREVMITFDDGVDSIGMTELIRLTLKRWNLIAAFFCVGNDPGPDEEHRYYFPLDTLLDKGSVEGNEAVIQRLVQDGHYIGNHTMHHAWFNPTILELRREKRLQYIRDELCPVEKLLDKVAPNRKGKGLVRPPYFATCDELWQVVREEGYRVVMGAGRDGKATAGDWDPHATVDEVEARVLELLKHHDWRSRTPCVLTFHVTYLTAESLDDILKSIKDAGYTLVDFDPDRVAISSPNAAVRSTTDRVRVGVEAGPVSLQTAAGALLAAAAQRTGSSLDIRALLPTTGPSQTVAVGPLPVPQTTAVGNATEAFAIEFRKNRDDIGTTEAVVLVMKTLDRTYLHDYAVCARFHWYSLDACGAVPVSVPHARGSGENAAWLWFSRLDQGPATMGEKGCQFTVFVNESQRTLTVDSRWIDKQYSPYWHNRGSRPYDYIVNVQVWASHGDETVKLVSSVLEQLEQLRGNWSLTYANRQEPTQPVVFVREAWLTADTNVYLLIRNCSWSPRLACFHGTKQKQLLAEDEFFEEWLPIYPGDNPVSLPLGQMHNAVIHCEVDGFMDKVFVSTDRQRPAPLPPDWRPGRLRQGVAGSRPKVTISWPRSGAKVTVLRDQLDMPDDDDGKRLAINGTVVGAPPGSTIDVFVYTDRWYKQDSVVTQDGLWGARIPLSGQGAFNKHSIYVRLRDANGTEIAHDRVDRIVRKDPFTAAPIQAAVSQPYPRPEPAHEWDRILVEAKDFQAHGGCYREAKRVLIVGGGPDGPYSGGGSASCHLTLPQDASAIKLRMSIWHGMETEFGKGVHSVRPGGTVTVYVNDIPVYTIVCRYRGMYGDFWPEQQPELGRQLPEIDLAAKGIKGRSLTIKIVASPGTCMDLRGIEVQPVPK